MRCVLIGFLSQLELGDQSSPTLCLSFPPAGAQSGCWCYRESLGPRGEEPFPGNERSRGAGGRGASEAGAQGLFLREGWDGGVPRQEQLQSLPIFQPAALGEAGLSVFPSIAELSDKAGNPPGQVSPTGKSQGPTVQTSG